MNFKDESKLIDCLKQGNEAAFDFVIKKYSKNLFAYALSLIHDHDMAKDIVQNVFFNTWRYRKRLKNTHSIKSFLLKSIYNEFINTYNKNRRIMPLQQAYYENLFVVVKEIENETLQERILILNKAIEKLPPKTRKIFLLSKKEGLTNFEVAEFLNISIKTVESQITKAFKILRKAIKK